MMMREATPEERKRFYMEEWDKRDVPDFILHTLSLREFGFDLDGTGPNNRYNQFVTVDGLENFLRTRAPYSAYTSVALYEQPSMRKGWLKAELAFDIDAKDLPLKTCGCSEGSVCEVCLDEARRTAAMIGEVLRSDLGLRSLRFAYSGRGFHIRAIDDIVMKMEQSERTQIVSYVIGGVIPSDMTMALGYSRVFRKFVARTLERLDEQKLSEVMRKSLAKKLIEKKGEVLALVNKGRIEELQNLEGMGPKSLRGLLDLLTKINYQFIDGKVTVDTKRILRLPSSLHSGVSMKCIVVRDIERFSLEDAIPKFLRER